jgi:hypothetical protein
LDIATLRHDRIDLSVVDASIGEARSNLIGCNEAAAGSNLDLDGIRQFRWKTDSKNVERSTGAS